MLARPQPDEYGRIHDGYMREVSEDNVLTALEREGEDTMNMLGDLGEEGAGYRYRSGKWSIKEVLGHLTDSERIFAYRALRIGRNDPTPLASFEQDDYVAAANFDRQELGDLLEQFRTVRRESLLLFRSFDDQAWVRRGVASGIETSTRAYPYLILGHERHHKRILRERYLPAMTR